jgi:sugar diacid utilization regulator
VRLVREGALPTDGLIVASKRLGALALHGDPAVLRELAAARLEPLAALTPGARARLEATLLAWLRHQGNVAEVAGELHVHPQTVRYRLPTRASSSSWRCGPRSVPPRPRAND